MLNKMTIEVTQMFDDDEFAVSDIISVFANCNLGCLVLDLRKS